MAESRHHITIMFIMSDVIWIQLHIYSYIIVCNFFKSEIPWIIQVDSKGNIYTEK